MEKLTLNTCYSRTMLILQGRGISPNRFFESVVFMDGVACGDAVFSAIEMNLSSEQNNNNLKSASNLNGNLNCSKELEHYAS
uniref:hypothetical protein n=1 Tax=Candidatus Limisoma sp. TaxID=3076476 RepID=UPI003FF153C3